MYGDADELTDPHFVRLHVENKSRQDIQSADFDQGKPLVFDIGARVVAIFVDELLDVRGCGNSVAIFPTLIPRNWPMG